MMPHLFHMDGVIMHEMHSDKRCLKAVVIVITKEEWAEHMAAPILLLV